jgi:dihydropteroate synthase
VSATSASTMRIGPREFGWGERTYVIGICNVTPDSFSGDGLVAADDLAAAIERTVAQARAMVAEGADVVDIGGESTRPGHVPVSVADEIARVVPAITAVRAAFPYLPISIDTTKPEVAHAAVDAGADLLNDVWGVRTDEAMVRVAADRGRPLVLMHNRAEPIYDDVVAEVVADLRAAMERAERAGVQPASVIVDPGIGFGKTADHNVTLLRGLSALRELGRPILLGTSRKSTLGRILDLPVEERLEGTLATTALGVAAGVDLVRVHDVRPNVRAARVADAIVRGNWRADAPQGGQP